MDSGQLRLISVLRCLSALGMWREQIFSPRKPARQLSLPARDAKGSAALAKPEPNEAHALLGRVKSGTASDTSLSPHGLACLL